MDEDKPVLISGKITIEQLDALVQEIKTAPQEKESLFNNLHPTITPLNNSKIKNHAEVVKKRRKKNKNKKTHR